MVKCLLEDGVNGMEWFAIGEVAQLHISLVGRRKRYRVE